MTDSINVPTKGACTDGFAGYVITPAGEELVASPEMTTNGIRGAVNAMFNDIIEASDGDWGDDLQMGFDTILAEHDAAIASLEATVTTLTKAKASTYQNAIAHLRNADAEIAALKKENRELFEIRDLHHSQLAALRTENELFRKEVANWKRCYEHDVEFPPFDTAYQQICRWLESLEGDKQ